MNYVMILLTLMYRKMICNAVCNIRSNNFCWHLILKFYTFTLIYFGIYDIMYIQDIYAVVVIVCNC